MIPHFTTFRYIHVFQIYSSGSPIIFFNNSHFHFKNQKSSSTRKTSKVNKKLFQCLINLSCQPPSLIKIPVPACGRANGTTAVQGDHFPSPNAVSETDKKASAHTALCKSKRFEHPIIAVFAQDYIHTMSRISQLWNRYNNHRIVLLPTPGDLASAAFGILELVAVRVDHVVKRVSYLTRLTGLLGRCLRSSG